MHHKNNLCQDCEENYSREINFCKLCPEPVENVFKLIGLFFIFLLYCGILIYSALGAVDEKVEMRKY